MIDATELELRHPIAQRLADLAGIEHDLELCIRACNKFISEKSTGSEDAILTSRSIATFAIISYFRTISTGVRSGISESHIKLLPEHLRIQHDVFKSIRDKFVAHSINQFEENSVQIGLVRESEARRIDTISTIHSRTATFSKVQISELMSLAQALIQIVGEEYDSESNRVWKFLESLPAATLDSILRSPTQLPRSLISAHKSRKRIS